MGGGDRSRWRKMVYSGSHCFQDNANTWAKIKRVIRNGDSIDPNVPQFARNLIESVKCKLSQSPT